MPTVTGDVKRIAGTTVTSGEVRFTATTPVVQDPDGNTTSLATSVAEHVVPLDGTGSFSTTLPATGPDWVYRVEISAHVGANKVQGLPRLLLEVPASGADLSDAGIEGATSGRVVVNRLVGATELSAAIAPIDAKATEAKSDADNAVDRVEQLEILGGVAPGDPIDATIALHMQQPGSQTETALSTQAVQATQGLYVPAELAMTVVDATNNPDVPRGSAPGTRIFLFDDQLPSNYVEGTDLLARPKDYLDRMPTDGLVSAWDADALIQPVGSTVTAWPDLIGTTPLRPLGTPTFGTDGVRKFVATDGVDDAMLSDSGPGIAGQPVTFAVVARYAAPAASQILVGAHSGSGGFNLALTSTSLVHFVYAGTSVYSSVEADDQWHVFLVTLDGANSELMLDGQVIATGDFGTRARPNIQFGGGGAAKTPAEFARAYVYDRVLTTAERAGVSAGLRQRAGIGA